MNPYAASLATFLEEEGLTQGAFAEIAGMTQASISRWATGERFPDAVTARTIEEKSGGRIAFDVWKREAERRLGIAPESEAA